MEEDEMCPKLEFDGIAEVERTNFNESYFNEVYFILGPSFLSTFPSWQVALAYTLANETICVKDKDYKIFVIPLGEDRNAIESKENG